MKTTLTTENLVNIILAMQKIHEADRSECFNDYYKEISKIWIERELSNIQNVLKENGVGVKTHTRP